MRSSHHFASGVLLVFSVLAVACSSDDAAAPSSPTSPASTSAASTSVAPTTEAPTTNGPTTEAPATDAPTTDAATTDAPTTDVTNTEAPTTDAPTTEAPAADDAELRSVVELLASDELAGRDNGTDASRAAQDFLIGQLQTFSRPLVSAGSGADAYRQVFDSGTNLIGLIPGSDLADEYVIVGAHYDHLGADCAPGADASDVICNGATDNATGVAEALAIGRSIASDPVPPRRSVVIALWDAEEDGLLGSTAYVASPLVPLAQTVAYVNFDIQGTSISPTLVNTTVMVGAETGGPNLVAAAGAAASASALHTVPLSLLFGQGRSDHATFVGASVPSVFFTDATPPCYHTVGDDTSIVDYPKLLQQQATAESLTRDLVATDSVPAFDPLAPAASFADAVSMRDLLIVAEPDFVRFSEADRVGAEQYLADLVDIVEAGEASFDDAAVGTLLNGAVAIVTAWSNGACEGFLG